MTDEPVTLSPLAKALRLGLIAVPVIALGAGLACARDLFDPNRLTPARLVDTLEGGKPHPGYRRNHAKGVCVTGWFESNGQLQRASRAALFAPGRTPVVGRFALPGPNPYAPDSSVPIRSLALRFTQPDGQQWRTGMNSMPVFAVGTPEAFYQMLQASAPQPETGKPDPARMQAFFASHPETEPFRAWVKTARPSLSYASERYDALNAFYLVDAQGQRQAVRWRVLPQASDTGQPAGQGADYLAADLQQRLAQGPLRWTLQMSFAGAGDVIDDASKPWPADRPSIDAGTLVLDRALDQNDGPCRDVNYDPTIVPDGIEASADPLLAARSAAYAASYRRRAGETAALQEKQP